MSKSIPEDAIDNMVHRISKELSEHSITLDSDELSILNEKLEQTLFHDLNIEID